MNKDRHVQSGAVKTRSIIPRYCIQHCSDCSRTYSRHWTRNIHPISLPVGRAMECLSWTFCKSKNLDTYTRVPPKHGPSYHDIAYTIALIAAENIADVELKLYTPYLFLWGELWSASREYFVNQKTSARTFGCRQNTVHHITILNTTLLWLQQKT